METNTSVEERNQNISNLAAKSKREIKMLSEQLKRKTNGESNQYPASAADVKAIRWNVKSTADATSTIDLEGSEQSECILESESGTNQSDDAYVTGHDER